MKLIYVTIENYRSITSAKRIPISNLTTLIGANNEGKSNILRALALGIAALSERSRLRIARHYYLPPSRSAIRRRRNIPSYNWNIDFPVQFQSKKGRGPTKLTLEFQFSPEDITSFQKSFGVKLNGTLTICIAFKDGEPIEYSVQKQGPSKRKLDQRAARIASFISDRIEVQYIPAVRTAESAGDIIESLVELELSKIEGDPVFVRAIADIESLQKPVIDALSSNLTETIKRFAPRIRETKVEVEPEQRRVALRRAFRFLINDGVETPLEYKGDGVQSLAALALMQYTSSSGSVRKDTIIALEEPESHLHPDGIRSLKSIVEELSKDNQVILTTHSPIFANRISSSSNIIISSNTARPARSIREIRDVLGVRVDDNLTSAEVILIVEGEEDRIFFSSYLLKINSAIAEALADGRLAIDILGGASNLTHRARLHRDNITKIQVFLDDDKAGRDALQKALSAGVVSNSMCNLAAVGGRSESELEDMYAETVYSDIIKRETGFEWVKTGRDKERKWSDRVRNILKRAGRSADDASLTAIKILVAGSAASIGVDAIHESKRGPIDSLVTSLLLALGKESSGSGVDR